MPRTDWSYYQELYWFLYMLDVMNDGSFEEWQMGDDLHSDPTQF
jgi:hypothetical protein